MGSSARTGLMKRIIQNKMSTREPFWRVSGRGSQNQNRESEFDAVQKVNTVAEAEDIRSYEA